MPTSRLERSSIPKQTSPRAPLEVLILDDERFDRHRLARLCSGLEFACNVSNAKLLAEFQEHLDQTTFGLILLDYGLPDGTGMDALEMMRLCARNVNTPAVMVSGQNQPEIALQAQAAGCYAFLGKDELSKGHFARAVKDALTLKAPLQPLNSNSFDPAEVEQLLVRSAALCAQDIKPMVSRMMRQLRQIRTQEDRDDSAGTQAVEQNCLSLWSFLIEMERQDGAALLANITAPLLGANVPHTNAKKDKPPSPFSAPRH